MAEQDSIHEFLFREDIASEEAKKHGMQTILSYIEENHPKSEENWITEGRKTRFGLLIKKYISIVQSNASREFDDEYYKKLRELAGNLDKMFLDKTRTSLIRTYLNELETEVLGIVPGLETENSKPQKAFDFYNVYSSGSVNTVDAEKLVKQAVSIIKDDDSLTSEAKDKIIQHLEKALKHLDSGNIVGFYGTIKEVVIILGAIGSLVGGAYPVISQATDNLQKATEVVEQSSVNIDQTTYFIEGYCPEFLNSSPRLLLEGSSNTFDPENNQDDKTKGSILSEEE